MTEQYDYTDMQNWLQAKVGQLTEISSESGLGYWWILKFKDGKIPNPGHDKILKLQAAIDKDTAS